MVKKISIAKVAELVDGRVIGDEAIEIEGFGSLEEAGGTELSFMAKSGLAEKLEQSGAAAVLVPRDFEASRKTLIQVDNPVLAAAIIQNHLLAKPFAARGIHETAVVGSDCLLPDEITIGPNAVIGDRVRLGERVSIGPGTVIGDGVSIGDDCDLRANVTIEYGCELGERTVIHSGTVIGSDGYGYATDAGGRHVKRPQLGIVRIGDDVEIGANCCVDRATFGVTWIHSGTKIDNLVQVAHNVEIGENSLIVAQVGLAGSVVLGRNVVFGGGAGAAGHQKIGDGSMVAGRSAVHGDQPAGSMLAGTPAIAAKQWFKAASLFGRLPDLVREVRKIGKDLERLSKRLDRHDQGGQ